MSNLPDAPRHLAVIGGGMSGLAAAHRVTELDPKARITLLEASGRVGGVLETIQRDGYLVERSADNFITNVPWALDLCRRIGFEQELLQTNKTHRRALVVRKGRLHPVPEGFVLMQPKKCFPLVTSPLLSPLGKLRLLAEAFIAPRRETSDESLASFSRRRLGNEAFDRLVQPLVGGIYTADPEKLSMQATLSQMVEKERRYGSLIRAARHEATAAPGRDDSGARYSMFVAPREGFSQMIAALVARLPEGTIRLKSPVEGLERQADQWRLTLGSGGETIQADGVIVALPAYHAAPLLSGVDKALSESIGRIEHAGSSVVVLGYREDQFAKPPEGFGFVVPAVENRQILAGSFSSIKYAGRAPQGRVLVRVFIGGALQSELAELPDDELVRISREELGELVGVRGEPELVEIVRWLGKMPQYHVGHLDLVERIESLADKHSAFALAGNAYRGVGIPQCIRSGEQAAENVLEDVKRR